MHSCHGVTLFPFLYQMQVPLLPNVLTSQFGFGIQGGGVTGSGVKLPEGGAGNHGAEKPNGRGRFLAANATKNTLLSPTSPSARGTKKLSVVNELIEGFEKAAEIPTNQFSKVEETFSRSSISSKDSTLKNSDFEVDSLEQEVVLFSTKSNSGSNTSRQPQSKGEGPTNSSVAEHRLVLPPPPHNPNVVVNYADPHSSTPLSPIWNQIQYFQSDSNTSTNSEYITSYIGHQTPLPTVLSPDFKNKMLGGEAGRIRKSSSGGTSSDSDHEAGRELSSGESGEEGGGGAKESCLKWKRGKLLGKGAYGKVWEGLLSSAHMIAVKEVELDTESLVRAQSVSST